MERIRILRSTGCWAGQRKRCVSGSKGCQEEDDILTTGRLIAPRCLSPAPGTDTVWELCMKREWKLLSNEKRVMLAGIKNREIRSLTVGLVLMTGDPLRYCGLEDGGPQSWR